MMRPGPDPSGQHRAPGGAAPEHQGTSRAGSRSLGPQTGSRGAPGRTAAATGADPGESTFQVAAPSIALPTGGGAIRGIDEQFEVNAATGTLSLSFALPFTAARGDFRPPVRLAYDSGSGDGVVGLGWSLAMGSIRRRTDRGVPRYRDDDTYQLAGSDDLVPSATWTGAAWEPDVATHGPLTVRRYRPRTEHDMARIERITLAPTPPGGPGGAAGEPGAVWWRVTSRDDLATYFGLDDASRLADPADPTRVLQWLPSLTVDNLGNCCVYEYASEDLAGYAPAPHDANRRRGSAPFTHRHLTAIRYGNHTPFSPDEDAPYRPGPPPAPADFRFTAAFDYGQLDPDDPVPTPPPGRSWATRPDPFSQYRGGFEVRTQRLLRRVLMFHQFEELDGGRPTLVRSLDLTYTPSSDLSMLTSLTQSGYIRTGAGYSSRSLPPVELDYEPLGWSTEVRTVDALSSRNLPGGVVSPSQWFDLDGDGISGVLTEQLGAWLFKPNLGDLDDDGQAHLGPQRVVASTPSLRGLATGSLRLTQLDGDGRHQLEVRTPELQGYYPLGDDGWSPFRPFLHVVHVDLQDQHVRQLDLVGDGRADILVADVGELWWYRSLGTAGHEAMQRAFVATDDEHGPAAVFADEVQSLFLADMSGDGLSDIVRVRNADVSYWPNLGYGRFGARVAMDSSPRLDHPEAFQPKDVRLADLTGTGTADLVYLPRGEAHAYLNRSGNGWSERQPLAALPTPHPTDVSTVDLLGNGTTCLVWSSGLPTDQHRGLRYVDPTGGRKPYLLRAIRNNLGREQTIAYKPSTWFALRDRAAGRPWLTQLTFPVQCVRSVTTRDAVSGATRTRTFGYRHGYYDADEREFRGFAVVDELDAEDFDSFSRDGTALVDTTVHQTPILTRTWFHNGSGDDQRTLVDRLRPEHWDARLAADGVAVPVLEPAPAPSRVVAGPGTDPAMLDGDTVLLVRQATRSCRATVLRREVFGLDAPTTGATVAQRTRERTPYSVASHGSVVTVLQPPLDGHPAVVAVAAREVITTTYERDPADPRVEHTLTLEADGQGNVLRSAAVRYARAVPDLAVPAQVRAAQARTSVVVTRNELTTDAVSDAHHRLRRPARTSTWEITGLTPANGGQFVVGDFLRAGFDVLADSAEVPHADRSTPLPGQVHRRLLTRQESVYYDAALADPLPLFGLDTRALPYESYQLAFAPDLLTHVFAARWTPALLTEGGYVLRDGAWWVTSGRWHHTDDGETPADATARFYVHVAHTDALGARTTIGYLDDDCLVTTRTVDAAQNATTVTEVDLRTMCPVRVVDPNGNAASVLCDELGLVKATALEGKAPGDADALTGLTSASTAPDAAQVTAFLAATTSSQVTALGAGLLHAASSRVVYDIDRYRSTGGTQPPRVATIVRERHGDPTSPVQVSFEYSNGAGAVEMTKAPAEPGPAARVRVLGDGSVAVDQVDTTPELRWVGTGRRVLNTKGKPVKEYEPFFSVTPAFETAAELVESGVTKVTSYDPIDRPARVDFPDGTFSEAATFAWRTVDSDRNDTVTRSAWFTRRTNREIDAELVAEGRDPVREAAAATRAAVHADTPLVRHLDPAGQSVAEVEDLGTGPVSLLVTAYDRDVESRTLSVTDPRGNVTMTYEHDLRGTLLTYAGPDGGRRRMLDNVVGDPLRLWDDRGHEFVFTYADPLHRVTGKRVRGGDGPTPLDHLFERVVYGEGRPQDTDNNLRGQIALRYDTAGRSQNVRFDLHGNLAERSRRFAADYRSVPSWDGADPDQRLEPEVFTTIETRDALDRLTARTTPDGTAHTPVYNAGNLLESLRITRGAFAEQVIANIDYDARGSRARIVLGNGVRTTYRYDRETFRLIRLHTTRAGGDVLQDLASTFDPVGNLTHLVDTAVPTIWRSNQVVTGEATYRYDPSYRLVEATGREHAGQLDFGLTDNVADAAMLVRHDPNDPLDWRTYTEGYHYDASGNLDQLVHTAAGPGASWTRDYHYQPTSNRLIDTVVGATTYPVGHHPTHGFVDALPHLSVMEWTFRDELRAVATQRVVTGTPETTWYVYDGDGIRVRKVTDSSAAADVDPVRRFERYSFEGVEIQRDHDGGGAVQAEHRTVHVLDDTGLVALIETDTSPGAVSPPLTRYQSINHLGSTSLETDSAAAVISYEEFHPFGTTAYQAVDKAIAAAAKRFRYTGMERDDESGLEYHQARYYVPWLGRWTSPDLHADQLDGNRYAYVKNNPTANRDSNGKYEEPVHGAATYRLALAAGFTEEDAGRIAIATAGMDHDKATNPGDDIWEMQAQIWLGRTDAYHFPTQQKALNDIRSDIAGGTRDLEQFGRHLHSLEDVGFVDAPGPHMRSDYRLLSEATLALGAALIAGGYGLVKATEALAHAGETGWAILVGILAGAALLLGVYLVLFAIKSDGVGHPWYITEKGAISHSFSHVADEAYQDPVKNAAVLNGIYRELVAARIARYGNPGVAPDNAGATETIDRITHADNAQKIKDYVNAHPFTIGGVPAGSYADQITNRAKGRWTPAGIDATVNNDKVFK
ncbi:MAG TPA: SpvB/TcaC N-terminal domain-containing protein [Actinotalea sp.]